METTGGAATISLNTDVYGLINVRGDNDYYNSLLQRWYHNPIINTLPADYQLDLLSSGEYYYYHQPITARQRND
jgi:hypothetical protein